MKAKEQDEVSMTAKEFCHWLRGVLSVEPQPSASTVGLIQRGLDAVFRPKAKRTYQQWSDQK